MNKRDPHHDSALLGQAAEFLARRDAGWTPAEAADFALWRATDPRHEAAVRRAETTRHLLQRLPEAPGVADLLAEVEALSRPRPVIRLQPWLRAAGALAAAAAVAFGLWTVVPRSHSTVTFAATAGQHRTVDLTDGSTLLLNSGSEVDVRYEAAERRVNLRQGEVHFSVAKDAQRPFIVAAGPVRVRAVGTAFNVRLQPAAIEVIVTEGKVQVSRDEAAADTPLFLVAGESALIGSAATGPLPAGTILPPDALREKLAWQAPRLEFADAPLAEVVARFNRHSPVQLELGDPELATRRVGGTFDGNNAEAFANLLLATGDVRLERASPTRIILRPAH